MIIIKYIHSTPPPKKKIFLNTADRISGVIFSIASGFLRQKTDLVKRKEVAVTSVYIHVYSLIPTLASFETVNTVNNIRFSSWIFLPLVLLHHATKQNKYSVNYILS